MSHTVDEPIFLYLGALGAIGAIGALGVVPGVHSIGVTACYLSICGTRWTSKARIVGVIRSKMIRLHPLAHDLLSVDRIDGIVACPMKDNGWYDTGCTPHGSIGHLPLLHWIWPSL